MARIKIDDLGTKRYYNDEGDLHREDGPAVIFKTGTKWWYRYGEQGDALAPDDRYCYGLMEWYFEDYLRRENGPYSEYPNGFKQWYWKGNSWPNLEPK